MSVCIFTVSNTLLMSSATVIVRSGGLFWLKPVAMVMFFYRNKFYLQKSSTKKLSIYNYVQYLQPVILKYMSLD